jgi:hypothetical protein
MVIAVDFDGTIVEHEFPDIGPLKEGAIEALMAFKKAGHQIVIWTCRKGEEEKELRQFLTEKQIPFDTINSPVPGFDLSTRKIYADVYIDDKALRFKDNWSEIRKMLLGEQ